MFKNILYLIAGAVIATLVIGVAGIAYAQTQTPPAGQQPWYGMRGGMMGGGYPGGMMGRWNRNGGTGLMHPYMVEAFAEKLGMTSDELQIELTAGKTMWQVAQEKGLSDEEIRNVMQEAAKQALSKMVTAGVITQQQADWMLQRMEWKFQNNGYGFGNGPCHGGNWGGPGSRWAPTPTPSTDS